jgi:protein-disulfide isomerase
MSWVAVKWLKLFFERNMKRDSSGPTITVAHNNKERWNMAYRFFGLVFCIMMIMASGALAPAGAEIEWNVVDTLEIGAKPIDMQLDAKGSTLYVLTDKGQLLIFDVNGQLKDRVEVGKDVKKIQTGPREGVLFLLSAKAKAIRVINLDFIEKINIKDAPFKGPADAPVTIVVFSDFQCPYCSRMVPILEQLHQQYPEKVKIVFKQFPLRSHRFATKAAQATIAAAEQDKFWPFHDMLFQNYNKLNDEKIEEIRNNLDLDADKFAETMASDAAKDLIAQDLGDGKAAGVRGTPTLFVNGKRLRNKSLAGLRQAVEEALARAK